jgi:hypothetical protein
MNSRIENRISVSRLSSRKAMAAGIFAAVFSVTSGAAASAVLEPVNLGAATRFAVLAASLVSNIPGSAVVGDIGLSPAAGSMITGFGPNEVTGTIFTVDATGPAGSVTAASELTAAQGDVTIAYNDVVARTPVPAGVFLNPGTGNLGGMTLVPGLYKFTSGASISGSDLTLSGGADDVWIFQIASELIVGNGIKVILAGGARAGNIFWQVGTSATLGTTSVFKGTILADQSISLNTGASLEGRALARIAAVTMASNAITRPAPTTTIIGHYPISASVARMDAANLSGRMLDLEFSVPSRGMADLRILDTRGMEIARLFRRHVEAGTSNRISFSKEGMAPGVYFARLDFAGGTLTKAIPLAN